MTTSPESRSASKSGGIDPSFAFMSQHWTHWLALGFGSGLVPKAPGTAGTALAWLMWFGLTLLLDPTALLVIVLWSLVLGVWICDRCAKALGAHDHPAIVWDEIAAFWAVLWLVGDNLWMQLVGFALFRFFDAVKPPPIGWVDRRVKGGFGIMIDDALAALATMIVIWMIWQWI